MGGNRRLCCLGFGGNGPLSADVSSGKMTRVEPQGGVTTWHWGLKTLPGKMLSAQHLWLSVGNKEQDWDCPLAIYG